MKKLEAITEAKKQALIDKLDHTIEFTGQQEPLMFSKPAPIESRLLCLE